jgi:SNF2 family DNA or RNA helicase
LALSERLAKELSRVQQLARVRNNKVIIPRFEVGLLGEMLNHPESILREDEGVAELLRKIDEAARMPIEVPKDMQAQLRDYQEEGYRWMTRLAAWGAGACLADDMGLGKTVQTIAVLLNRAAQGPSLVVAPASVVYNWQSEIERFAPTLKVHVLHETDDRKRLVRSLRAQDVLLTTYGLLVREEKALTDKSWNVVCLDEAHTIKNRQTKMSQAAMCLRADFRIALTGTPLQNYLSELWNLFQFINPGLLGSYEAFSHDFITPIEAEHDKQRQQTLRQILQPFLLRRTKAEVIDELPEKTEIIRRVELSDAERVAYEAMRIEAQMQVAQASKVDVNVLASITRLRQAADSESKLEDFTALLTQIVTGGNRVLVFSQFTTFLSAAQHVIGEDISAFYLDGSTPLSKRKQMVERFQNGEAQVFFISLKAGGLGLNLTGANYVIHLDPWWNPAIEQQATDRAYRIGQRRNVTVYHLIAADTIEEKILRLHKTKRDLADALLQDQNTAQTLTLDDLKMLLETIEG